MSICHLTIQSNIRIIYELNNCSNYKLLAIIIINNDDQIHHAYNSSVDDYRCNSVYEMILVILCNIQNIKYVTDTYECINANLNMVTI